MIKQTTIYILVLIVLSSYVYAEAPNWIRPTDLRDDLYGMLIYDGNINITFDGDFTVSGGGNDTDTNETVRFNILTATDCAAGQLVIGINTTGGVLCVADDILTDAEIQDLGFIKLVNVSAVDTKWITDKPHLYNDNDTIYFNESQLAVTYYNATLSEVITGTIDSGALADTQHQDAIYDGVTFNFTEASGSPGLDLRMNFTNISSFTAGVIRYKTSSLAGDYPIIQLWNYDTSEWEDYPPVSESSTFATITQPVFDASEHISSGIVQMRIYKAGNGNTNNHYYVDWVSISKGFGVPAGEETDPYSVHRDGTTPLTANWNAGSFNITADYFIGDGSLLTNVGDTNFSSGGTISGNIIISSPYNLTVEGHLIINNLTTSEDIRPALTNIYSLGNSTKWFKELYVTDIHNQNFYGNFVNASEINSTDINSNNVNSTTLQIDENITLGGHRIIRQDDNFAIVLT